MQHTNAMPAAWHDFLLTQNAHLDDLGQITSFGNPEIEHFLIKHGPVVTSLSHQALLKVTGSEAFDFLQGQLTADLKEVTDSKAQYSAYCDPQGNVLAIFLIFKYQGDYYLSFDASLKPTIQKRLQMFILRSDVQLIDMAQEIAHIGFAGEFGDVDIQRRLNTKVKEIYECGQIDLEEMQDMLVIKVPGPYHKYQIFGPAEQMQKAWQEIRINCDVTNTTDWNLLDIAAAVPIMNSELSGKFTAQFLNLDKFNAISFKKGCFPGQEIIARIHYRGKITRRMLRLRTDEVIDLNSGDEWILNDNNDKSHKLTIVQCGKDIFQGSIINAIGNLRSLEAVEGDLRTENGELVVIEPLPYKITEEE